VEWPITAENWKAWVAVGSTLTVFAGFLSSRRIPTDLLFVGGLLTITLAGVITPEEALAGFASPAILAIGALLICSAGLRSTGVLDWLGHQILGSVKSDTQARRRLAVVLVAISAFVLNTAVVAMFMPVVLEARGFAVSSVDAGQLSGDFGRSLYVGGDEYDVGRQRQAQDRVRSAFGGCRYAGRGGRDGPGGGCAGAAVCGASAADAVVRDWASGDLVCSVGDFGVGGRGIGIAS
jgi:hypothetical protein